jgi:hypothetical protein
VAVTSYLVVFGVAFLVSGSRSPPTLAPARSAALFLALRGLSFVNLGPFAVSRDSICTRWHGLSFYAQHSIIAPGTMDRSGRLSSANLTSPYGRSNFSRIFGHYGLAA